MDSLTCEQPPSPGERQTARPAVVSIQSQVVYGCAGNSAAEPLLMRLGAIVYSVPTILLSNTPLYPTVALRRFDGDFLTQLFDRLLERVDATDIDAILTGYMGSADAVMASAAFIDRVRASHPGVTVHCDPVMGEVDSGLYVEPAVAEAMLAELVPRADILTPNTFEASLLVADGASVTLDAPLTPSRMANGCRASLIIDTGRRVAEERMLVTTAASEDCQWRVRTEELVLEQANSRVITGTGDVFAATFLYRWLLDGDIAIALSQAALAVSMLVQHCQRNGTAEMWPAAIDPQTLACTASDLSVHHEPLPRRS